MWNLTRFRRGGIQDALVSEFRRPFVDINGGIPSPPEALTLPHPAAPSGLPTRLGTPATAMWGEGPKPPPTVSASAAVAAFHDYP